MTVSELCRQGGFSAVNIAEGEREIAGAYACDLLSWVIGRAPTSAALVTVMTNVNVIAVAVMAELSCVILCEGVKVDDIALEKAKEQGVNVLSSDAPIFETCNKLGTLI